MDKKEDNPRFSPFTIYKKCRPWFYGILSIFGIIVVVYTLITEWKKSWIEIIKSIGEGVSSLIVVIALAFIIIESFISVYQYYLDCRAARDRKIREEERAKARPIIKKYERFAESLRNELMRHNVSTEWVEDVIRNAWKRAEQNDKKDNGK